MRRADLKSPLMLVALAASGCSINVLGDSDSAGASEGGSDGSMGGSTGGADTGVPTTGVPTTGAGDGSCDFAADVQPIFTARCALGGCHDGATAQLGLDLGEGAAHAELVGVDSASQPGTLRVAPGDPAASLLLLKLGPNPPVGARMPIGGALSAAEIAVIEAWVAAGASAAEAFACAGGGGEGGEVGEVVLEPGPGTLAVGGLATLGVSVTDGDGAPLPDAALSWASSDALTLYVDGVGGLLGVSPGKATVTASAGGVTSAPVEIVVSPATPPASTFTAVRGLLVARCAVAGCHVDGVEPGDLRFDRPADKLWEELVGESAFQVPALDRVAPNAPRDSYLLHKLALAAPPVGARMPLGQAPLAAADAQVVLRWILAGAGFDG